MTAYAFVTVTITDQAKMAEYREKAGPALAKYGAQPLKVSPDATWLDGDGPTPDVAVLLSFPDREAAQNWRDDPDFAEVHQLRNDAGTSRILLL